VRIADWTWDWNLDWAGLEFLKELGIRKLEGSGELGGRV